MPLLFLSNTTENEISWICINYFKYRIASRAMYANSNTVILIFISVLVGHNI